MEVRSVIKPVGGATKQHWIYLVCPFATLAVAALMLAACGTTTASPNGAGTAKRGILSAVGAENQYANVISQIGGKFVSTLSVESNPNTDPHSYELSPTVAGEIGSAQLVVQNGLGYDAWVNQAEAANANSKRMVIDVQTLLGLANDTPNPHLWYRPSTMPRVAAQVAKDLTIVEPDHAAYFSSNVAKFDASLDPWHKAVVNFRNNYRNVSVAVTEPVANYLLQAMGIHVSTPFSLQEAIMNGYDPSPEDVTTEDSLLSDHKVDLLIYNSQVTDSITSSFTQVSKQAGIPIVGVSETMPSGSNYESWMLAETNAIIHAVKAVTLRK